MLSNVEQDAVQFLDSIFCCKHRLYLSQQMNVQMDTDGYLQLHGSVAGGWIWCVCLCFCVYKIMHCIKCVLFFGIFSPLLFPLPPRTLDYPECLSTLAAWRSAEFAFVHREREGKRRKEDKAEIMSVCVCACGSECVSALNVCGGKRRTGGGRRRGST